MDSVPEIMGPKGNFVGLLQEKCQKNSKSLPTYEDLEGLDQAPGTLKKCLCKLETWTKEGTGFNKKEARQNAAKLMLEEVTKVWSVCAVPDSNSSIKSAVSKLNIYCGANKKQVPLFSEKGNEETLFVTECTFDNYTAVGKGSNKKEAKEKAAEGIVKHFGIDTFIDDFVAKKKRGEEMKNPVSKLTELCQVRKLCPCFSETTMTGIKGKTTFYVVTCVVDNLEVKSSPNHSKKSAKIEAATLMVNKLQGVSHSNVPKSIWSFCSPQSSDFKVSSPEAKIGSSSEAKTKTPKVTNKSVTKSKQKSPFKVQTKSSSEGEEYSEDAHFDSENSPDDEQFENEESFDDPSSNGEDLPDFLASDNEGSEESESLDVNEPLVKRFKDVY